MHLQFSRLIAVLPIIFFTGANLVAQNAMPAINSPVPVSPNAASLGKYGEIPVGLYTGIPNITVPLYEIQSGSLKLPVTVNYHAGGMKVEEVASWVGLGWSLNAGGVITRQVRGIADETDELGYLYRYDSLDAYLNSMTLARRQSYLGSVTNNTFDSQQDMFTYNIGGESGRFIFQPGGGVVSIPLSKNKFEYGTFLGKDSSWRLIDMNGTVYYFTDKEITSSVPLKNGLITAGSTSVSSWYVTKMISASGKDTIHFTYDINGTHFNTAITQTKYVANLGIGDPYCGFKDVDNAYSTVNISGKRLTQISFANGSVQFFQKSSARDDYPDDHALDSIEITNTENSFYKKYKFYQSYNTGSGGVLESSTEELKRMFLDSIVIFDVSKRINNYRFIYDQSSTFPSRNSFSQDFWGYFNGVDNGSEFVPSANLPYGVIAGGADRKVDSTYCQLGILKTLFYPTGGRTEFEFESNHAGNLSAHNDYLIDYDGFYYSDTSSYHTGYFTVAGGYGGSGGVTATISINNGGGACAELGGLACPVVTVTGPSDTFQIYQNTTKFLPPGEYVVTIDMTTVYDSDIRDNFELSMTWPVSAFSSDTMLLHNSVVGGLRIKKITNYANAADKADIRRYTYNDIDSLHYSSGQLLRFPEYISTTLSHNKTIITMGAEESPYYYSCGYTMISSGSNYPLLTTQGSYVGYKYVQEHLGENGEFGKNEYTYTDPDTYGDVVYTDFPYAPTNVMDWRRGQLLRTRNYGYLAPTSSYKIIQEKTNAYSLGDAYSYDGLKVGQNEIYTYSGIGDPYHDPIYATTVFTNTTSWFPLASDTIRMYDQNDPSRYTQTVTNYSYGANHYQPIAIKTTNSKGDTVRTHMMYPLDYSSLSGSDALTAGIKNLQNKNVVSPVIEKYTQIGTDYRTTQATITSYKPVLPLPDTIFTTELSGASTSFSPTSVSSGSIVKSALYQPQVSLNKYDNNGNIVEQQKLKDAKHTYLWDYLASYPVAEISNADSTNVAYTSFETGVTGNWTVSSGSPVFVTNTASPTGSKYFTLTSTTLQKTGLSSGNTYIVSYWSSTGTNYTVSGTVSSTDTGATINGWTYIEHQVTGASTISVSGTGAIDELRLYPKGALMTTYTYQPLVGITSQCDAGNRITYYEYDSLGRLLLVKDEKRKILKTLDYRYK